MKNALLITILFPITRPESDFDAVPDVSALIGEDDSGMPMLGHFSSSVALTQGESRRALAILFDSYESNRTVRAVLREMEQDSRARFERVSPVPSDEQQLEIDRAEHRCT